ncbi:MAG TPA: hypothetical protein VFO60_06010 [Candidatus Dormibacteraeota bacterium]|nr:hypothetical protein [Candidatus Dormibacteraeota bacterium]
MTVRRCARRRALFTLLAILALPVTLAIAHAPVRAAATPAAVAAWAPAGSLPGLGSGHIWSLAIDPANAAVALAATDHGVYRSQDAGRTWVQTSIATGTAWVVGFDQRKPNPAFAGLDHGGVARSDDAGATWAATTAGLPDKTVRTLAFGLAGIAAGTAGGVAISADGTTWRAVGLAGYDVSSLVVAANAPAITLFAATDHGVPGSTATVFKSTGLAGWDPVQIGGPDTVVTGLAAGVQPADTQVRPLICTTTAGVYRSGDGGVNWSKVFPPPSQDTTSVATLSTAAFSPLDPRLLYGGDDAGGSSGGALLRSTDGGLTFSPFDQGLPDTGRNVVALAVSPTNPPLVLVALDPPGGAGHLLAQTDTTAPAPAPTATPEAAVQLPQATPLPTFTPPPEAVTTAPSDTSGDRSIVRRALDWPLPLAVELLVLVVAGYVAVRLRQRYLDIEGPP